MEEANSNLIKNTILKRILSMEVPRGYLLSMYRNSRYSYSTRKYSYCITIKLLDFCGVTSTLCELFDNGTARIRGLTKNQADPEFFKAFENQLKKCLVSVETRRKYKNKVLHDIFQNAKPNV